MDYPKDCRSSIPASTVVEPVNICGESCNLCNYQVRKPACQQINYVEKTCPIKPKSFYKSDGKYQDNRTVYQSEYVAKLIAPAKAYIPKPAKYTDLGPIVGQSLYKKDFIPFPVTPYQTPPWSEKEQYKPCESHLNGITTHKSSYQPVHGCPAISAKPSRKIDPNMGPLDDQTTYKTDFVGYGNCVPTKNYKPAESLVEENCAVFDGRTMYNVSFQPPCSGPPEASFKPKRYLTRSTHAFDGRTSYQEAYLPFAFQKCRKGPQRDCYAFSDWKV